MGWLLGIFIWAIFAGHPFVALFVFIASTEVKEK